MDKKKTALVILIVILALTTVGGPAAVWYWQSNKAQKILEDKRKLEKEKAKLLKQLEEAKKESAKRGVSEEASQGVSQEADLVYTNTEFGFRLTLPKTWSGYKTKEAQGKYIYFELPTSDPNFATASQTHDAGYVSMFAISVYTPSEWNSIPADQKELEGQVIQTTSSYVYVWSESQSGTEETNARRDDIESIIKTFTLL